MLTELVVQELGVIESAELTLDPGCVALTGETGAGKTLVVAAVGLLLGGRTDSSLVRASATEARIEGRFVLPGDHPAVGLLVARDLLEEVPAGDAEIVISRTIATPGRQGKVRVNGRLASLAVLAEVGPSLAEIAGQNEHQRIGAPGAQRDMLDSFAGPEAVELAGRVRAAVGEATRARRRAAELREGERARAREVDVLRYEIAEIEGAGVTEGEGERLSADASRLGNAEELAVGLNAAVEALHAEGGAEDRTGNAEESLRPLCDLDPQLSELRDRLSSARVEIADIASELSARIVDPDPAALRATRERLDELSRLRRKFGDSEADILEHLQRSQARLRELEGADEGVSALEEAARSAHEKAAAWATELSGLRRRAATDLASSVTGKLASLALPGAVFEVSLDACELDEGGFETTTFLVSANPGDPPKPLSKVASGGELSRIALALHLTDAGGADGPRTIVFDEVDAGVGGVAAQSVGQALADLASGSGVQVVVVTHLPQVAAFAHHQLKVSKEVTGGVTRAAVTRLSEEARVEELSRMLAGLPGSGSARDHARELLELAGRKVEVG